MTLILSNRETVDIYCIILIRFAPISAWFCNRVNKYYLTSGCWRDKIKELRLSSVCLLVSRITGFWNHCMNNHKGWSKGLVWVSKELIQFWSGSWSGCGSRIYFFSFLNIALFFLIFYISSNKTTGSEIYECVQFGAAWLDFRKAGVWALVIDRSLY